MLSDEEALFAQLEGIAEKVDADTDIVDLTTLSVSELLEIQVEQEQILKNLEEITQLGRNNNTREGRDAHSKLYAVTLELRKRI